MPNDVDPAAEQAGDRFAVRLLVTRQQAAELLARAYRITDDWQPLLDLVEVRVASGETRAAVAVLRLMLADGFLAGVRERGAVTPAGRAAGEIA